MTALDEINFSMLLGRENTTMVLETCSTALSGTERIMEVEGLVCLLWSLCQNLAPQQNLMASEMVSDRRSGFAGRVYTASPRKT